MALHIGVDIGGTKIAAGIVDSESPTHLLATATAPTPRAEVLDAVAKVIAELLSGAVATIGVGAPGVIDPEAGVVVSAGPTMPGWQGTHIAAGLRERFSLPVAVHNDVRIMGLGETVFGAGREFDNVLFVSLGTGVGGAIVRGGKLVPSAHNTAGELRGLICHNPSAGVLSGRLAKEAIDIESVASGSALTRAVAATTGRDEDLRTALARRDEDPRIEDVITRHLYAAGQALGGFITAIDVDAVVLGGGVGNIGKLISQPLAAGLRDGAFAPIDTIPVVHACLGNNAPIIGAAYYGAHNAPTPPPAAPERRLTQPEERSAQPDGPAAQPES